MENEKRTVVWAEINKSGPLLTAASSALAALRATKVSPNSYRLGDQKWENRRRYLEFIFIDNETATVGRLSI